MEHKAKNKTSYQWSIYDTNWIPSYSLHHLSRYGLNHLFRNRYWTDFLIKNFALINSFKHFYLGVIDLKNNFICKLPSWYLEWLLKFDIYLEISGLKGGYIPSQVKVSSWLRLFIWQDINLDKCLVQVLKWIITIHFLTKSYRKVSSWIYLWCFQWELMFN